MFDDEMRVKILKALADQVRLEIIRTLYLEDKEMGCGQISEGMEVGNSTISYHLKTLREAGLTYTRREGQHRYITLRKETFEKYLPGFLETLVKE